MRRILIVIMALAIIISSGPLAVLAQRESGRPLPKPEEIRQRLEQEREQIRAQLDAARRERIKQRCGTIKDRLNQVVDRVRNLKDKRENLYNNIKRVLGDFVDRLKQEGVDTAELESDIATLNSMIDDARSLWETYMTTLVDLMETRCDVDSGIEAFHAALETAKQARIDVKEKLTEIRGFIRSQIRPKLQALREELRNKRVGSGEERSTEQDTDQTGNTSTENNAAN